jgi:hypothetical protein
MNIVLSTAESENQRSFSAGSANLTRKSTI